MKLEIERNLLDLYNSEGTERVGFILKSGEIIECENVHPTPETNFSVHPKEIIEYEDRVEATWHSHPDSSCNLSSEDYIAFISWPEWTHFIVGKDGVKEYFITDDGLIAERE